jgi:hypothetical protein
VCDKVVVECSSLGYGRAGPEEGFIEKYSQSFGDAERAAGVFHCVVGIAEGKVMIGLDRHGEVGAGVSRRAHPSSETSVKWLMVGKMVNDVPVGFHEPFPRRTTSLPSCVLYTNISLLTHPALVIISHLSGLPIQHTKLSKKSPTTNTSEAMVEL